MEDGVDDLLVPDPGGDLQEADEDAELETVLDVHGHHVLRSLHLGQRHLFRPLDLNDRRLAHGCTLFAKIGFLFCKKHTLAP